MDTPLTLLGSIVIGSLFLLGLMRFHGNVVDYSNEITFQQLAQETTASFIEIIDQDFRSIGSGLTFPATSITGTSQITFLGDIDRDGIVETVRYFTSLPSAAPSPNPNDRILYRVVDGDSTIKTAAGVTAFNVTFLDKTGNPTANLMAVRTLDVFISLESLYHTTTGIPELFGKG